MDETTVNHGRTEGASGGALVALVFGLFGICAVAAAAIAYGLYPGYIDHGEPTVAIQSWRLLQGEPVYLPFEAAERTSNLYGPWLFLIHAGAFWAAGPSLWAGKLAALAAAAALPVLVFRGERRCGPAVAGWMAFLAACYVFLAAPGSLWGRPDPFLALAALAAIRLAEDDRAATPSGAALFGLVCGLAVGMKLFAAI